MLSDVTRIQRVEAEITDWLKGEHDYQFGKNLKTHAGDPRSSIDYLLSTEIESKWVHFQEFNTATSDRPNDTMRLQANQRLLKTCAGARAALLWSYVLDGVSFDKSNEKTWQDLDDYYASLRNGTEPYPNANLLQRPLAEVVLPAAFATEQSTPEVKTIFEKIAGLTLVHLASADSFVLPAPGVSSGTLNRNG